MDKTVENNSGSVQVGGGTVTSVRPRTEDTTTFRQEDAFATRRRRNLRRNERGDAGGAILGAAMGGLLGAGAGALGGLVVGALAQVAVNGAWHFSGAGLEAAVGLGATMFGLLYGSMGALAGAVGHSVKVHLPGIF